jgi:hypothetical protein
VTAKTTYDLQFLDTTETEARCPIDPFLHHRQT